MRNKKKRKKPNKPSTKKTQRRTSPIKPLEEANYGSACLETQRKERERCVRKELIGRMKRQIALALL